VPQFFGFIYEVVFRQTPAVGQWASGDVGCRTPTHIGLRLPGEESLDGFSHKMIKLRCGASERRVKCLELKHERVFSTALPSAKRGHPGFFQSFDFANGLNMA